MRASTPWKGGGQMIHNGSNVLLHEGRRGKRATLNDNSQACRLIRLLVTFCGYRCSQYSSDELWNAREDPHFLLSPLAGAPDSRSRCYSAYRRRPLPSGLRLLDLGRDAVAFQRYRWTHTVVGHFDRPAAHLAYGRRRELDI